jgi:hypothetical protein
VQNALTVGHFSAGGGGDVQQTQPALPASVRSPGDHSPLGDPRNRLPQGDGCRHLVQNSRRGVGPWERAGRSQGGTYLIRKGGTPMSIITILIIIILVLVALYLLRRVF